MSVTLTNFVLQSKVHSPSSANNPFLSTSPAPVAAQPSMDLFGSDIPAVNTNKASEDLLQLNPFVNVYQNNVPLNAYSPPQQANMWNANGNGKN